MKVNRSCEECGLYSLLPLPRGSGTYMLDSAASVHFVSRLIDQSSSVALFAYCIFFLTLVAVLCQSQATLFGEICSNRLWRKLARATQRGREAMTSLCTRRLFFVGGLLTNWVWSYKADLHKALLYFPLHRFNIAGDTPTICRIQRILRHVQSDLPLELSTAIFIL